MVEKKDHILYVDGLGKQHNALVTAVNQRGDYCPACQSNARADRRVVGGAPCGNDSYHNGDAPLEHYVSLVVVDDHKIESDNVVKFFDVKHISMMERETSPGLPSFQVNCWKYEDEDHDGLPDDHPAFDHPFKVAEYDENGVQIDTGRPKFAGAIADHHDTLLAHAGGSSSVDVVSGPAANPELHQGTGGLSMSAPAVVPVPEATTPPEPKAPEPTPSRNSFAPDPTPPITPENVDTPIEVVKGVPSAEDLDPTKGGTVIPAGWDGPIPPGKAPSAEDLDQVAAEQKAAEATGGGPELVVPEKPPAEEGGETQ